MENKINGAWFPDLSGGEYWVMLTQYSSETEFWEAFVAAWNLVPDQVYPG